MKMQEYDLDNCKLRIQINEEIEEKTKKYFETHDIKNIEFVNAANQYLKNNCASCKAKDSVICDLKKRLIASGRW